MTTVEKFEPTDVDREFARTLIKRAEDSRRDIGASHDHIEWLTARLACEFRIHVVQQAIAEHRRIMAGIAIDDPTAAIELGDLVVDEVTGYAGTVTAIRTVLHGGRQMLVEDGKRTVWLEGKRLQIDEARAARQREARAFATRRRER